MVINDDAVRLLTEVHIGEVASAVLMTCDSQRTRRFSASGSTTYLRRGVSRLWGPVNFAYSPISTGHKKICAEMPNWRYLYRGCCSLEAQKSKSQLLKFSLSCCNL